MNCNPRLIAIVSELSSHIQIARQLTSNCQRLAHSLLIDNTGQHLAAVYSRAPVALLGSAHCQRRLHTTTQSALFGHTPPKPAPGPSRKRALDSIRPPDWYFKPMNHFDVIRALVPIIQKELGTTNALGLYASLQAMSRWQSSNRSASHLPGVPAMANDKLDYELINATYHILRYATATYGWKGMLFFYMTDTSASAGVGLGAIPSLVRTSVLGDAASFCHLAGICIDHLIYESDAARLGMPKHFIVADETTHNLVLAIRGTMSINDTFTDLVTRPIAFCDGEAHEGIAHGAHAIYAGTLDILSAELEKRPGWGLVITGHSLGAATSILYTILLNYYRDKQMKDPKMRKEAIPFGNVRVSCVVFAPPPVFAPLTAVPEHVQSSICCWVNNEDIVARLSLESVRDLVRILRKIGQHEPSMSRRFFTDVDIKAVLESEPEWYRSWTGKDLEMKEHEAATAPKSCQHDEVSLNMPAGKDLKTRELTEGTRFQIPGTIYCFRAPVDVGAAEALTDYTRHTADTEDVAGNSPASPATPQMSQSPTEPPGSAEQPRASVIDRAEADNISKSIDNQPSTAVSVVSGFGSALTSGLWSVASATSAAVAGIGSTIVNAASDVSQAVQSQISSVYNGKEDDVQLKPKVAREASRRAKWDTAPFVTLVRPEHIKSLPLTNRAWRDHVPDMYLNVFRQLKEVADRQNASRPPRSSTPAISPAHGLVRQHYLVGEECVAINGDSLAIGETKSPTNASVEAVEDASSTPNEAIQRLEEEERRQLGEDMDERMLPTPERQVDPPRAGVGK